MSYTDLWKEFKGKMPGPAQVEIPVKEYIERELTLLGFAVLQRALKLVDLATERAKDGDELSCDEKQAFREEVREEFEETRKAFDRIIPLLRRDDEPTIISPVLTVEEQKEFEKKFNSCVEEATRREPIEVRSTPTKPSEQLLGYSLHAPQEANVIIEAWAPGQIVAFPDRTLAMPSSEIETNAAKWFDPKTKDYLDAHGFTVDNFKKCFPRGTIGMVVRKANPSSATKAIYVVLSLSCPLGWTVAYGQEMSLPVDDNEQRLDITLDITNFFETGGEK